MFDWVLLVTFVANIAAGEAPAGDTKLLQHLGLQNQIGKLAEKAGSLETLQLNLVERLGSINQDLWCFF